MTTELHRRPLGRHSNPTAPTAYLPRAGHLTSQRPSTSHRLLTRLAAVVALALGVVLLAGTTTGRDSHAADAATTTFQPAAADAAALSALVGMYSTDTPNLWPIDNTIGWWTSANALSALMDAERAMGTHRYDWVVTSIYQQYGLPQGSPPYNDFRNHYFDDTAWWGIAWLDAYRWIGDPRYLATAEADDAFVDSARGRTCGGGIAWAIPAVHDGDELNSITNELAGQLAAELAVTTGRASYRAQALEDWRWLSRSGLLRFDGLVLDHLDAACRPTGAVWSYTQGTLSAQLTALEQMTGDSSFLIEARRFADAATSSAGLNPGGILTDPCEPAGICAFDGAMFKGADVRGLSRLNAALPDHPYTAYLHRQAVSMYTRDRMSGDTYGQSWAGAPDQVNTARQASAVDLLTAVA